jgi:hypothetical protein
MRPVPGGVDSGLGSELGTCIYENIIRNYNSAIKNLEYLILLLLETSRLRVPLLKDGDVAGRQGERPVFFRTKFVICGSTREA